MKTCPKCGETKPLDAFSKNKSRRDGRDCWCRSCKADGKKKAYKTDPTGRRKSHIKSRYKLSAQEYEDLLCLSDASCMICGLPASVQKERTGRFLCVDHDHNTGKVRGILCDLCNKGLGAFRDDARLLQNALNYLTNRS